MSTCDCPLHKRRSIGSRFVTTREVGAVGYSRRRVDRLGRVRWMACYRDMRGNVRSGRQRFARYVLEMWLPNHVMEANTRQGYVRVVERDLLPVFGLMRMNEILSLHVRDFVRWLEELGMSPCTVQRCKTGLSAIFTTALHDRVIFLHPCTGVRVPATPPRPLRMLTPAELDAIVAALPDEEWQLMVEVTIGSGVS
jgi:site-specific recombinase XerD